MNATTTAATSLSTLRAQQFGRVVANMASGRTIQLGADEVLFGLGVATIVAWRPRADTLILQGVEIDDADVERGYRVLRTCAVIRGGLKGHEVVADGGLLLAETRGVEAAIGIALDFVQAPAVLAEAMQEADPFGC